MAFLPGNNDLHGPPIERWFYAGALGGLAVDRGWVFRWKFELWHCRYHGVRCKMADRVSQVQCRLRDVEIAMLHGADLLRGTR